MTGIECLVPLRAELNVNIPNGRKRAMRAALNHLRIGGIFNRLGTGNGWP
jgi:predicted aspartyl protease